MMKKSLEQALASFKDKIADCIKSKKSISVITHIDCDGIASGSIISKALIRAGANCTVSTTKELNKKVIQRLQEDQRDFHVITDLGGGFIKDLDENLADKWFVLDHHQIPQEEYDNERVINAWKFGIDGGTQVCAGGMAFEAAVAIDGKNKDLAWIAVVAALGDRQDQGEKKSFTGINSEIVNVAKKSGQLEVDLDLLLVGRETRPLPDALAFTSQPFIEGLTWNRDTCLSLLNSAGIKLKDGGRWRVPAELNEEEKRKVIESIAKFTSGKNATEIMDELIGYTYTFPREDRGSFLRDGREFSTMLNSCGRIQKAGVGIAVCMGDRTKMLKEGENILVEYRQLIRNYMNILSNERWRINDTTNCVMVNAEGVVPETMTGTISSLIAGSPKNAGKIVIIRTNGEEGTIKFSSRKSFSCKSKVNLSNLMRSGAEKFDGVGGGHDAAAGAKITKDKLDAFLDYLEQNVLNVQGADNSR